MGLTGPNELWLKTVRAQDKRGVPLARRKTTNREALEQTSMLQKYRTASHYQKPEQRPALGNQHELNGQCLNCGKAMPKRRGRKLWKEKRTLWLASGPVRFYVCPKCQ